MSRMGKKPIDLDARAKIKLSGQETHISGPKGSLSYTAPPEIKVKVTDQQLLISRHDDTRQSKALHGLVRSLLQGMLTGVTDGFKKELEFQGVGYRGQLKGKQLVLNLGYSNPVEYEVPDGVDVSMPDQTHIVLESCDKQKIGQAAAIIRAFRPPDAYKGKGIRYVGEQVALKEGKTV